ncbi:hypothetical protein JW872_03355 [Candidatus Babeliales bacterium]|nr:hypothetical protein [Candidatus Babeliales bacterium]
MKYVIMMSLACVCVHAMDEQESLVQAHTALVRTSLKRAQEAREHFEKLLGQTKFVEALELLQKFKPGEPETRVFLDSPSCELTMVRGKMEVEGDQPLHLVARWSGKAIYNKSLSQEQIMALRECLLQLGADPNALNGKGRSAHDVHMCEMSDAAALGY